MIRGRMRWHGDRPEAEPAEPQYIEIDPRELSGIFNVPDWLRNVGLMSWLLVGVAIFLVGAVWLASLTAVIVVPVITAGIVAAVASPLVDWLHLHRVPARARGGPPAPRDRRNRGRRSADDRRRDHRRGVGGRRSPRGRRGHDRRLAQGPRHRPDARSTRPRTTSAPAPPARSPRSSTGSPVGISKLSSLVFFVAMTVLSLFFLLKDGPLIRSWADATSASRGRSRRRSRNACSGRCGATSSGSRSWRHSAPWSSRSAP